MNYKKLFFIFLGFIFLLEVNAQDKSNDTTARYFLIQASIGNLQEAAIGKLAVNKAVNPNVKAFASQMVKDHNLIETQLMQVVHLSGIQLPSEAMDIPVEDLMLKNTPSEEFDKIYIHMMTPDHRQTVQLFEKYALTGKNSLVKAFAAQALPTIKQHLIAVMALDKVIDIDSNSKSGK